jgi:hypothetical protein
MTRPSTRDQLFEEPECRSRRPSQTKEQGSTKGKPPLSGRRPGEVKVALEASLKTAPAGLPGPTKAKHPAKASPLHLTVMQVIDRCGVKPQSD